MVRTYYAFGKLDGAVVVSVFTVVRPVLLDLGLFEYAAAEVGGMFWNGFVLCASAHSYDRHIAASRTNTASTRWGEICPIEEVAYYATATNNCEKLKPAGLGCPVVGGMYRHMPIAKLRISFFLRHTIVQLRSLAGGRFLILMVALDMARFPADVTVRSRREVLPCVKNSKNAPSGTSSRGSSRASNGALVNIHEGRALPTGDYDKSLEQPTRPPPQQPPAAETQTEGLPVEPAPDPRQQLEDDAKIEEPRRPGLGDSLMNLFSFFGVDTSWDETPGYEYTDRQKYAIDPSAKKPSKNLRCDAALTRDGKKLEKIAVMSTRQIKGQKKTTWSHRSIPDTTTYMLFLSRCPLRARKWAAEEAKWEAGWTWAWYCVVWLTSFIVIWIWFSALIVWKIIKVIARIKRNFDHELGYESFAYTNKRYAVVAANPTENREEKDRAPYGEGGPYNVLKPHTLVEIRPGESPPYKTVYYGKNDSPPPYIFIAYNSKHFDATTAMKEAHKRKMAGEKDDEKKKNIKCDYFEMELLRVAYRATQFYGKKHFYLSSYCNGEEARRAKNDNSVRQEDKPKEKPRSEEEDIYAMSDIIRAAEKVVIIMPDITRYNNQDESIATDPCPPLDQLESISEDDEDDRSFVEELDDERNTRLGEWGERVWTFPEVVLGPDVAIGIFWKEDTRIRRHALFKSEFPHRVWRTNPMATKQLLESYTSTKMTALEFLKICLGCLMDRRDHMTKTHPGDISYVLMGFTRIRPPINKNDTAFQAFARLSLPADNDHLMERLICLEPSQSSSSPSWRWEDMLDAYKINIWNIAPKIQVSGVGPNDTVFISSSVGARIELQTLTDVSASRSEHRWRSLRAIVAGFNPHPGSSLHETRQYLRARLRDAQPRLFAFEGFMELNQMEEKLFGAHLGVLGWSPHGSTLSRHECAPEEETLEPNMTLEPGRTGDGPDVVERGGGGERIRTFHLKGVTPWACSVSGCGTRDWTPTTCDHAMGRASELRACGESPMGQQKVKRFRPPPPPPHSFHLPPANRRARMPQVYTLVDTATMTVTIFRALWPPQVLVACGTEGGLERILACSYDWTTGTFYREAVLRFPGKVLEHMHRLPGIRLGLRRVYREGDARKVGS
ncbi:hypothetical protein MKZ38_002663 [Zalerion maritima]|uniref:Uncharacterized protein n=1 Tax=Zalerion maritima TaxID=339359 RepID=A0AAD5RPG4_9PEZI|nr:hypothetical protein MKZ38_002663 [Zalerion maritima]